MQFRSTKHWRLTLYTSGCCGSLYTGFGSFLLVHGIAQSQEEVSWPCQLKNMNALLQVAALQQTLPGLIAAVHMSYIQDSTVDSTSNVQEEPPTAVPKITFLYKLAPGVADRSFGLNVARMAHLPPKVVDQAAIQALQMEQTVTKRNRCFCMLHLAFGNMCVMHS